MRRCSALSLLKTRAELVVGQQVTFKSYYDPARAAAEIGWYQQVPWAHPKLIDADPAAGTLIIATEFTLLSGVPTRRQIGALGEILHELHRLGIHHRDVHPGNVVFTAADEPLLIDWETAIETPPTVPSYDLYGPEASGLPVPDIHVALGNTKNSPNGYRMYWNSMHRMSIRSQWRIDVDELSTILAERPREGHRTA